MAKILRHAIKDNKLVFIDDTEVLNGDKCNCFCPNPNCNQPLIAKNDGRYKIHHFAHKPGVECQHCCESALHIMAKNIIAESKKVYLPKQGKFSGYVWPFDSSEQEVPIGNDIKADVILTKGTHRLNVEVRVTHEVDYEKAYKIYNNDISTIEIDLSKLVNNFDEEKIKDVLLSGKKTKWIYSTNYRKEYLKNILLKRFEDTEIESERKEKELLNVFLLQYRNCEINKICFDKEQDGYVFITGFYVDNEFIDFIKYKNDYLDKMARINKEREDRENAERINKYMRIAVRKFHF